MSRLSRPSTHKFQLWFPKYNHHWTTASTFCSTELTDYWTQDRSRCWAICACAADCLLTHTPEIIRSNMATATVILGLKPSTISLLGPGVAEMSLLSLRNPLLAVLLGFASPAVSLTSLYRGSTAPRRSLGQATSVSVGKCHAWMGGLTFLYKTAMRVAKFALGGAMLVNTVQVSVYVDQRTVSGWGCSLIYMPLSWALSGGIVHLIGSLAIRSREKTSPDSSSNSPRSLVASAMEHLRRLLVVQSDYWRSVANGQDRMISEILFLLASIAGICHMFFGVLVFSSLIFVGALDTLPIVARYAVSAVICQAILLFELGGMRLEYQQQEMSMNSGIEPLN